MNLNPDIEIKKHDGFYVVRDDKLLGGTKQRGIIDLLKSIENEEFVYAGPFTGVAQIALALSAKELNKKATAFVSKVNPMGQKTLKAKEFGAKIVELHENASIKELQSAAEEYSNKMDAYLIPFGFDNDIFKNSMIKNIRLAWSSNPKPPKIWLICGSGTLLNILYEVFPSTKFCVVQIGKKIPLNKIDDSRTIVYKAIEKFNKPAKELPPYPSVATYDAKVWHFIKKYGIPEKDYVWNVARD